MPLNITIGHHILRERRRRWGWRTEFGGKKNRGSAWCVKSSCCLIVYQSSNTDQHAPFTITDFFFPRDRDARLQLTETREERSLSVIPCYQKEPSFSRQLAQRLLRPSWPSNKHTPAPWLSDAPASRGGTRLLSDGTPPGGVRSDLWRRQNPGCSLPQ